MAGNYNIGPRIGIEGEKEFRQQISRINSEYKSMGSYLAAVEKSMETQGRTQEALALKQNALRQQIAKQSDAYAQYSTALERVKALEGDHSEEITRYEGALLHTENTIAELTRELTKTETELDRMAQGLEDVGQEADDSGDKVLGFGDMLKAGLASGVILGTLERVGQVIVDVGRDAVEAAAEVKAANAQFTQTFGNLESTATSALRRVSNETGIATTRLQSGYTALYAFTKSVGGDSETALNIAERALTAAADSAAYYDRTVEDATETLQSFLKGNYANDAALGIAATETTRNAKANELYAKSFQELTEAQKVDTLLAMVEAGNKASGALGQAAREADSWANVQGEFNEAIRQTLAQLGSPILTGITPMIQSITAGLKSLTAVSSFAQLRADTENFQAGLQAAEKALEDSTTSMAATATIAGQYLDRLDAIEAAGMRTAESQREYRQTVELLNAVMPELGATINDVTGKLDQNTDALRSNIQGLKAQAEQQARNAYYQAIIDEYTEAYKAQYAAEQRLIELEEQRQILMERGARSYETLSYAQAGATTEMDRFNATLSADDQALAYTNREIQLLEAEMRGLNAALADGEEKLNRAQDATGKLAGEAKKTTAAAAELKAMQTELAATYATARGSARESIDGQVGLFDKLTTKSDMSARQIIKNWESQREAFTKYGDNLKKAVELGLDEALVQQLSDGSQQSMVILNELVNGTSANIDQINAAFRGLDEAKEYAADAMAGVDAAVVDGMKRTELTARQMGRDTGSGIARGVLDSISEVESAFEKLAKKGQGAYMHTMDQHSPSRVMRAKGYDSGLGAALGVEDSIPEMEDAMAALARSGGDAYLREQLAAAADYPSIAASYGGAGTTTTNNNSVAYGGISINISTQAGQDAHELAEVVLEELTIRLGQEGAAF